MMFLKGQWNTMFPKSQIQSNHHYHHYWYLLLLLLLLLLKKEYKRIHRIPNEQKQWRVTVLQVNIKTSQKQVLVHICSVAVGTLSYHITNILIKHVSAVHGMINLLWQFICLLRPMTHFCTLINQKQSGISSSNELCLFWQYIHIRPRQITLNIMQKITDL